MSRLNRNWVMGEERNSFRAVSVRGRGRWSSDRHWRRSVAGLVGGRCRTVSIKDRLGEIDHNIGRFIGCLLFRVAIQHSVDKTRCRVNIDFKTTEVGMARVPNWLSLGRCSRCQVPSVWLVNSRVDEARTLVWLMLYNRPKAPITRNLAT